MLLQTLKGFRDFLPEEARKRQYVINTLKMVFQSYGFEPLETPTLEYEEVLTGKYGSETDKLLYRFEDNGGRRVAMRYDQTVPLARVVASYQNELPTPFKRYQIQSVFRAENTQKGRFREFLQCDIDTVGLTTPLADAEILAIIADSYEALGFKDFTILVNDRSLFSDLPTKAVIAIDKLKKVGEERVKKELQDLGVDPSKLDALTTSSIPETLQVIIESAKELGVDEKRLQFEPTLARGLDYYTGIIIEVEVKDYAGGSLGGGGRYDDLIGMFGSTKQPAVGFAFGFDRIIDAMNEQKLFPEVGNTKVLVTVFSEKLQSKSIEVSYKLRSNGIPTELYLDATAKMEKQLKYADKKNIEFALIIGSEEAEKGVITLKNLKTRRQQTLLFEEALSSLIAS